MTERASTPQLLSAPAATQAAMSAAAGAFGTGLSAGMFPLVLNQASGDAVGLISGDAAGVTVLISFEATNAL